METVKMAFARGVKLPELTPKIERNVNLLSNESIVGTIVRDPDDLDLGSIKELIIDISTGRITYAILSHGGILGVGEKLFAIPWDALGVRADERVFTLNIRLDELNRSSGIDRDEWPLGGSWERSHIPHSLLPYRE
ncbi:MAG TPA: PRC-barrel domain-containing protein [Methanomicrobiales archaeon]|nr:PRC-barrel domain-containing protein [Methanomicrobiales archaeon]